MSATANKESYLGDPRMSYRRETSWRNEAPKQVFAKLSKPVGIPMGIKNPDLQEALSAYLHTPEQKVAAMALLRQAAAELTNGEYMTKGQVRAIVDQAMNPDA